MTTYKGWLGAGVAFFAAISIALALSLTAFAAGETFSDFAVFGAGSAANANTALGNNAHVSSGLTGGNSKIDLGANGHFSGVRSGLTTTVGGNTTTGGLVQNAPAVTLPAANSFTASSSVSGDRTVSVNGTLTLAPGTYRNLLLNDNTTLNLSAGTYVFNTITTHANVHINLTVTSGDVVIFANDNVVVGDNNTLSLIGGTAQDFYLETKGTFTTGANVAWSGTVYSTKSNVSDAFGIAIGNNNNITGALYSNQQVSVGNNGTISKQVASVLLPVPVPACDLSDDTTFDGYSLGSVNGQHGWASTGPFDQAVVTNTYGYTDFGCKTLRISNAVTSGSFADQTYSYSVANEAGETSAENGGKSGGTRKTHFEAQFDLGVATAVYQPGLVMSVSPDRGDGARMSYLRFEDQTDGIHVFFDDATFVDVPVATLTRAAHTIKFVMDFVDGTNNDVVKIYIDGALKHTGTSWENYFRNDEHNPTRTVDSLLFRTAGTAAPATSGKGFLIDNVDISTSQPSINNQNSTIVVRAADLETQTDRFLAADNNSGKWFFYNDENDTINNALGSFVSGPAGSLGDGSVQVSVTGTERRNLATYAFGGVQLSAIKTLKYSTYNPSAGNGGDANRSGYLNFNVSFDGSNIWQRRLVFVPANNGAVVQNSWNEWDAIQNGSAKWSYSGATWPTTAQAEAGVSGTTLKTWNEILVDYPDAEILDGDSFLGVRVGEPYADGYTENIDKFVFGALNGSTLTTKTFNFEPTQIQKPTLLGWNVEGEAANLESDPISLACNPSGVSILESRNSLNQRWTTVAGSNIKYIRRVSADNGANWNVISNMVFTGPSMGNWFSFGAAEDGGTFLTEVMAFNDANNNNLNDDGSFNASAWSNTCPITYHSADTVPPSVPVLTSPANGTTLNTNEFDFTWQESTDDQPGNITYEFHSSLDSAHDANDILVGGGIWTSGTLLDPTIHSTGAPDGVWYWQVRARDVAGNWSAWSTIWSVKLDTAPTPPPATPGVTTNAASGVTATDATLNATNNSVAAGNTSFWWGTTNAGPFTQAADPSGQLPSGWAYHPTGLGAAAPAATFSHSLSGLASGTTYYFVAWSQVGGVWYPGSVLSFSITGETAVPSATTNAANPVGINGATLNGANGPIAASNTSFWWGASSAGPMTAAVDPSGQLPSGWSYHPTGVGAAPAGGSFSHALSGLAASTQYHFVAWAQVAGTWYPGSVLSFTTSPTPSSGDENPTMPGALTLTEPSLACGATTNSSSVTVNWGASTDDSGTVTYEYWVTSQGLHNDLNPYIETGLTVTSRTGAFTEGEGLYTIKIRAVDANGNKSEWTAPCTVTYDATPESQDTTVPTVVLSATSSNPTSESSTFVTATFSEPVTGFEMSDIDASSAIISDFTAVSPTVWTFIMTPTGSVSSATVQEHKFADLSGNQNAAASTLSRTYIAAEEAPVVVTTSTNRSNGSRNRNTSRVGEVLGAEIGPVCSTPLLYTFMRMGGKNDTEEVKLLQTFLGAHMNTTVAVTGLFGVETDAVVKKFQSQYADEVLAPWGLSEPTGWVYKLTQWKINQITCAELNAPKPVAVIN
ncbi:MAG: exported protein of unknown function [Candidatus Adlerbacteria bacterium]|nr:exported protein of unknown function [Candidatus Adlerbacteria bacterium]